MERYQHGRASRGTRWSRWTPGTVLLLATAVDLVWWEVNTFPLLAAVPVLAAPLFSLSWTIISGVAASLLGMLLSLREIETFTRTVLIQVATIAVLTVVAVSLNRMFTREREELRTAREVAETVQRAVLPTMPDRVGGLTIATRYQAAQQEALIGGDLYALHDTPYGLRMVIGDVRGKGMQAVALVNALLGSFYSAALHVPKISDVVRTVDTQLQDLRNHSTAMSYEDFVTAVITEISPDHSVLRLANRGHPPPLMVHDGTVALLEPEETSLPLGLGDLGSQEVPVDEFSWPPGATLVMFTDGIIEARDKNGVFFDPARALTGDLPANPGAVLDAMLTALFAHTDELEDDAAALAITRVPADSAGDVPSTPYDG